MSAGPITAAASTSLTHGDQFQRLLLQLSEAASLATSPDYLLRFFCRASREFLEIDGVYLWSTTSEGLVGEEADGWMADEFRGRRLEATDYALITEQAIREQRTVYENDHLGTTLFRTSELHAQSVMAAPWIVANKVICAATFVHCSRKDFFDDDVAAKATTLMTELATLLESSRPVPTGEERRQTRSTAEIIRGVVAAADSPDLLQDLADRLRFFLHTRLVSIVAGKGQSAKVIALSAESSNFALAVRAAYERRGLQFAADLATRAIAAGELIVVATDPAAQHLEGLPAGILLAVPFHIPAGESAVLIYPRAGGGFSAEERSLVSAMVSFASAAIGSAELNRTVRSQAHELHRLLEIMSELNSARSLEEFLPSLVIRAADFLGFDWAFAGFLEEEGLRIRWRCMNGKSAEIDAVLPNDLLSRTLLNREIVNTDEAPHIGESDRELLDKLQIHQLLAVPLQGSDGQTFGVLGMVDRVDGGAISRENFRLAHALAAQAMVPLKTLRSLAASRLRTRNAESLMRLGVELSSTHSLRQFYERLLRLASELMEARGAALVINQEPVAEVVAIRGADALDRPSASSLLETFGREVIDILRQRADRVIVSTAAEMLGGDLASALQWTDLTIIGFVNSGRELLGALCLANRARELSADDDALLQSIAEHACTALENSSQFARMERANRHWMETFDAITDFIVAHNASDNVLRVNRSLADFIGVQPQELIGVSTGALFASETDAPSKGCPFCEPSHDRSTHERVHRLLDRTYLVSTSRVHEASGEGLQTVHVLKDITDRREAERRYRELFDNIQEGVFFSTPEGRFIEVNDALVRMLGYESREQLLQTDIRTQICTAAGRYDELVAQMQHQGAVRNHEQTLRRADGSVIHVLVNAFAVRDERQRMVQYRGVMLDISGLKAFQSELQRERDFSGKILNNTQSLILVADTAGLISYANRRWQDMGYDQAQLLGRPLEELVVSSRHKALQEGFAQTLAGQQVDNLELQLVRGEGKLGQFSVNLSPMRDEDGNVSSIVVVMSDITDVATIQAKLMHAEKMAAVGQLVSGVAHEVNNPLTAILGFTDLLMENPEVPESARNDLRVILQEAQRTKQIVQNLLSFARPVPSQRTPVQVNSIIRRTIQLRAYDLHSHGVEVVDDLDPSLPEVVGDSHQFQQVFLNILNNAYDAVRGNGRPPRIVVTTKSVGKFVEIEFRDNGHGVAFPERIFDPFFTTKEIGKGTGLGLSICYGIVRAHNGEILCRANQDEPGTTFVVRFPAITQDSAIADREQEEP